MYENGVETIDGWLHLIALGFKVGVITGGIFTDEKTFCVPTILY